MFITAQTVISAQRTEIRRPRLSLSEIQLAFFEGNNFIMKTSLISLFVLHFGVIVIPQKQKWKSHDISTGLICANQSCSSNQRTCHCDSFCTYFRDCCEDYESDQDTFVTRYWKNLFPQYDFLQCRSIPGYWKENKKENLVRHTNCPEETYWMISRCPPGTPKTLMEQCETEHSTTDLVKVSFLRPVHDGLGNVFKNYYCAKCHGISSEDIKFWAVDQFCWQCPGEFLLSQEHYANLSNSYCDFLLEHSMKDDNTDVSDTVVARLRWCDKDMIRTCPTGSDVYDSKRCLNFMSPGYYRGSYFKNIFCARCYGLENVLSWSCETLEPCHERGILGVSGGISFYDPLCSLIRCSRQYHLCDARRQYIAMVVDDSLKCTYLEERAERCFFQKSLLTNPMLPWKRMVGTNGLIDETPKHDVTVFRLPENASTDWRIMLDADLVLNARTLSKKENSCFLKYIEVIEVCSNEEWGNIGQCNGELMEVEGDKILDDKNYLEELKVNLTEDMLPVWYSVHTRFPFVERSRSEKRTLVCFTYLTMDQRSIWYKVFCGVCIAVAVVAHFATFCTYAVFKPLRNTFGISLMSFVMSLALSLCLQEFVNDYVIDVSYLCQTVAIVAHFFWLASFSWMNVLAWDLRATLSLTKMRVRKPSSRKRLGVYCCFGWGVPLAVVSTCIMLWLWNFHNLSVKYGSVRVTCWLSDDLIVLAAVGGPLVLCLSANTILFIMVARYLYKHKKSSKVLDAGKDPKQTKSKVIELLVYVKISMLMGFSWIFGILADFTKIDALWWFFYLSYLIQAVVIFVFFGLSPKARKFWRSTSGTSTRMTSGVRLSSQST